MIAVWADSKGVPAPCCWLVQPLLVPALTPPLPGAAAQSGVHVAGTELEGLHREVLVRAVRHLEQQGKAKLFKGALGDDEGVKFFTQA